MTGVDGWRRWGITGLKTGHYILILLALSLVGCGRHVEQESGDGYVFD